MGGKKGSSCLSCAFYRKLLKNHAGWIQGEEGIMMEGLFWDICRDFAAKMEEIDKELKYSCALFIAR